MNYLKKLYGKAIIDSSDSAEFEENRKIELEYYMTKRESILLEDSKPYGIEIIKKDLDNEEVEVEDKVINNICYKEYDTDKLLDILIEYKVTPVAVDDIIQDFGISLG